MAETGTVYSVKGAGDTIEAKVLGIRTIRNYEWKLITYTNGKKELYNIQDDPVEICNLANERPDILEELNESLDSWIASNPKQSRPYM